MMFKVRAVASWLSHRTGFAALLAKLGTLKWVAGAAAALLLAGAGFGIWTVVNGGGTPGPSHEVTIVGAPVPLPATATLAGIACSDSAHCVAAGSNSNGQRAEGVVVPVINGVAGITHRVDGTAFLGSVACPSLSACETVGISSLTNAEGVAVPLTGGIPGKPQVVPGTSSVVALACPGSSDCEAVGNLGEPSAPQGFAVSIKGGDAGVPRRVAGTYQLLGIACTTATQCVAVGSKKVPGLVGQLEGVIVLLTRGVVQAVRPVPDTAQLYGVACPDASRCVAVGVANNGAVVAHIVDGRPGGVETVQGVNLTAIACATTSVCEAVGTQSLRQGVVMPIEDGTPGRVQVVGSLTNLLGITCPTKPSCEAVGSSQLDGVILPIHLVAARGAAAPTPTPGGRTPTPRPPTPVPPTSLAGTAGGSLPSAFDPLAFSATSASDYWVLGSTPCSSGTCTALLRTTDGGRTFTRIRAPSVPFFSSPPFLPQLYFADNSNGYVVDSGIYETHDGGNLWHAIPLSNVYSFGVGGGYAYAITKVNAHCPGGPCQQIAFERSRVTGDTWSASAPSAWLNPPSMAIEGLNVWLMSQGPKAAQLTYSTNGGRTFSLGAGPPCVPFAPRIYAGPADGLWVVCPGGMSSELFRSVDSGTAWAPVNPNWEQILGDFLPNSAGVVGVSPDTALLFAGQQLLRTTDGGMTWHAVAALSTVPWSVSFTNARVGLALTGKSASSLSLWRTTDSGATWSQVSLP